MFLAHHTPQKVSRVTQTTPDTLQTPSRHLPDTPKYIIFRPIPGNWEKRNRLIEMSLTGCLFVSCTSYPPDSIQSQSDNPRYLPDTFQTPSRHLPDTFQTPSRQPADNPKTAPCETLQTPMMGYALFSKTLVRTIVLT